MAPPAGGGPGDPGAFAGTAAEAPGTGRSVLTAVPTARLEGRSSDAAPAPVGPDGRQPRVPVPQGGSPPTPAPRVEFRALAADAPLPAATGRGPAPEAVLEPSTDLAEAMRAVDRPPSAPAPAGGAPRPGSGAPAAQIEIHLARAAQGRIDRLVVQLEPADLGRVEIRLEFGAEGRVGAMISAERPETLEALQRDAAALERSLRDAGLRPDAGGLSFGLQRHQHEKGRHAAGRPSEPTAADTGGAGPEGHPDRWVGSLRLLDIQA